MSAYAALTSLQKILVTIIYLQPWISHNAAQLQDLLSKVSSLRNFLIKSSAYKATQISALEVKMRDASYKAEDLIEYGILDSESKTSFYTNSKIPFLYAFYVILILVSSFLLLSHIKLESVPARVEIGLELAFCVLNAVFLYLCFREIYVFPPLNDSQELRWVLHDFSTIAKEVNQIKEVRGETAEISSSDALISLRQVLDSIPDSGKKDNLKSLQKEVTFLLYFLSKSSATHSMSSKNLDETIIDAVSKAKRALIEFQLPRKLEFGFSTMMNVSLLDLSVLFPHIFIIMIVRTAKYCLRNSQSELTPLGVPAKVTITFELSTEEMTLLGILRQLSITLASYLVSIVAALVVFAARYNSGAQENQDLPRVVDDFGFIGRDAIKIMDANRNPSDLPLPSSSLQISGSTRRDVVVGLEGDLEEMKRLLFQDSTTRQLASIVGMGGIGKTTLARQVFRDLDCKFDVCAWVTVSQENSFRHVMLCLLDCVRILTEEMRQGSDDSLAVHLHKHLSYRRYLIVMDDVWDIKIWESLSRYLPDNNNKSRILITSRLPNMASRLVASSPLPHLPLYHMQCLNEDDSWHLLREKALGREEGFAREFESIGREIAQRCGRLPLAIVVIGGLLYKDIKIDVWRDVAENLQKSQVQDIKEQCWEILGLSYNQLPHHLRPCFLYMGFFPRGYEIPTSRLINLWVAEGFLGRNTTEPLELEEVAEGYLDDLINRNLILVSKRSCNGKIRTCRIHDLLRDVCVENSHKENFFHVMNDGGYVTREMADEAPRRLSIRSDALKFDAKHDYVRSVLYIASEPLKLPLLFDLGSVYLRVLDVLDVQFAEFPHQITKLVRLRYLALYYDGPLPPSISKLENLETVVHHSSSHNYTLLSRVIWRLPNLRHLYVKPGCYLSESLDHLLWASSFLGNLQTLVGIRNFKWSKGIIERIPNLKKLGISYVVPSSVDFWSAHQLDCLADLHKLESLKIIIKYDDANCLADLHKLENLKIKIKDDDAGPTVSLLDRPKLAFPQSLKKLSLSGSRIQWQHMTAIGELPKLEALKLRHEAFSGPSWETIEGEFPQLVFLLLEGISVTRWESDAAHFPLLRRLVLRSCGMLEEIPFNFGEVPTLEMIKLVDCHPSAEASANEIQEEQEQVGNETLRFEIERREEEDETDVVNTEARGVGPGVFQLVRDSMQNGGYEILLLVVLLGILATAVIYLSISGDLQIHRGDKPR